MREERIFQVGTGPHCDARERHRDGARCRFRARPMTPPAITVRQAAIGDLPAARRLLDQLGYAVAADELDRRFAIVSAAADHAMFVAEREGSVVALCHLYARPALDKPPEIIVQALVVDQACRGAGVGRLMMGVAESWAREHGFGSVALASSLPRAAAHAFYEAIGYHRTATSHLFRKTL